MACIYMSETSAMYHKARHINTWVYQLRDLVLDRTLKLYKVTSSDQTGDIPTKALAKQHCEAMLGSKGYMKATAGSNLTTEQPRSIHG